MSDGSDDDERREVLEPTEPLSSMIWCLFGFFSGSLAGSTLNSLTHIFSSCPETSRQMKGNGSEEGVSSFHLHFQFLSVDSVFQFLLLYQ